MALSFLNFSLTIRNVDVCKTNEMEYRQELMGAIVPGDRKEGRNSYCVDVNCGPDASPATCMFNVLIVLMS
jgi:hypothetical protein